MSILSKADLELLNNIVQLIEKSKGKIATVSNSEMSILFWNVGRNINQHILNNQRAEYGKKIVVTLSRELIKKYGRNFEEKNLRRMCQFASQFIDSDIVVTLSRHLSWSHIITLLPLKSYDAKLFYANKSAIECWGVRELRSQISKKTYERTQIANTQLTAIDTNYKNIFKDPYLLDFLELNEGFLEYDLESAILSELEKFILELGNGFTFVARQKRMIIDGEDFYLDLLFYHRKLKRLVAIELKIDKFKAFYKGQMELYLKWLDKYEKVDGEEKPIGLILCAESSKEQIELLEMHKSGIMVAEYLTELPPKEELEAKLHSALIEAKERIERRNTLISTYVENEKA